MEISCQFVEVKITTLEWEWKTLPFVSRIRLPTTKRKEINREKKNTTTTEHKKHLAIRNGNFFTAKLAVSFSPFAHLLIASTLVGKSPTNFCSLSLPQHFRLADFRRRGRG